MMTEEEKLRKQVEDLQAALTWRARREEILRSQFAFYVQHGQTVQTQEFPSIFK